MPVDIVLGGPGLEQMVLESAEPVQLEDLIIPVATAEHLVLMKLLAARPKDLLDAAAVVRATNLQLDRTAPGFSEAPKTGRLAQLALRHRPPRTDHRRGRAVWFWRPHRGRP